MFRTNRQSAPCSPVPPICSTFRTLVLLSKVPSGNAKPVLSFYKDTVLSKLKDQVGKDSVLALSVCFIYIFLNQYNVVRIFTVMGNVHILTHRLTNCRSTLHLVVLILHFHFHFHCNRSSSLPYFSSPHRDIPLTSLTSDVTSL